MAAAPVSAPYYYRPEVESLTPQAAPIFLDASDRGAFAWLRHRHDDGVVLARSDLSPWVAARAEHRVLVGHYLWTHDWQERRREEQMDHGFFALSVWRTMLFTSFGERLRLRPESNRMTTSGFSLSM